MYAPEPYDQQIILIDSRYFEGGVSSVFLWDLDDGGFAGVVLLKKGTHHTSHPYPYTNLNPRFSYSTANRS
jgi:capping protein (actin filament) muscle Z-line, beta